MALNTYSVINEYGAPRDQKSAIPKFLAMDMDTLSFARLGPSLEPAPQREGRPRRVLVIARGASSPAFLLGDEFRNGTVLDPSGAGLCTVLGLSFRGLDSVVQPGGGHSES